MFDEVHPVAPRLCRVSPSFANFFSFASHRVWMSAFCARYRVVVPSFRGEVGGGARRASDGARKAAIWVMVRLLCRLAKGENRGNECDLPSAAKKKIDSLSHISHRNAVNPVKPDDILNGNVKNNSVKTYKIPQNTSVRDQTPLKLLLQSSITSVDTLSHCKVNEYTFKARLT